MKVEHIYSILNSITSEVLGETAVVNEDLSNIVDIGTELFDNTSVDNYVGKLIDRIGKVVFVDRPYSGSVPSIVKDAWEFGSVLEKIRCEIPEAEENEAWSLNDRSSYDPNLFYAPKISVKFFNAKDTFEIPISITDKQVKESFTSASQINAFYSMIYSAIEKSMTIKIDAIVMRVINTMTAQTLFDEYGASAQYSTKSGVRAVNLLKLYNDKFSQNLTAAKATTDGGFIKFATYTIGLYKDRIAKISKLFNIGQTDKFTPEANLHLVLLSEFEKGAMAYLESNTYHNDLIKLPNHETVAYWQGSGQTYEFTSTSKIDVKIKEFDSGSDKTVTTSGILGVMFDSDACGVSNLHRYNTSNYNPKGEFTNTWFKADGHYWVDGNENFVVFFVA